jgi:4a-hydroxytetrahydrobiopterin dehydratase
MRALKTKEIEKRLKNLPEWKLEGKALHRTLTFPTYMAGIEFVNRLAVAAEEHNHHPDLVVGWCKVEVTFTTHDAGGVTELDFRMAKIVDDIYSEQE